MVDTVHQVQVYNVLERDSRPRHGYDPREPRADTGRTQPWTNVEGARTHNYLMGIRLDAIRNAVQQGMRSQDRDRPEQASPAPTKGQGKGNGPREPQEPSYVPRFDGNVTECSICQYAFRDKEMLVRLGCRHLFHEMCWEQYIHSLPPQGIMCPNCMAPNVTLLCTFPFVAQTTQDMARADFRRHRRLSTLISATNICTSL